VILRDTNRRQHPLGVRAVGTGLRGWGEVGARRRPPNRHLNTPLLYSLKSPRIQNLKLQFTIEICRVLTATLRSAAEEDLIVIPYRTPPASVRLGEAAHGPPIEAGAGTGLAADLVAAPVVMVGAQRV
jgi:hypothetical protein